MNTMIIYEDESIIVCEKPAGLPVQTSRISSPDLVSRLKNHLSSGKPPYLGVIHRLDQPVEGLLVFAKTKKAAAHLSAQLQRNEIRKEYLCITQGTLPEKEGSLENFLRKNSGTNLSEVVPASAGDGKKALLHYQVLAEKDGSQAVKVQLITGRHHQIRVQLAAAGAPLLGDSKYGPESSRNTPALCAWRLEFTHPVSGRRLTFQTKPKNILFEKFPDIY